MGTQAQEKFLAFFDQWHADAGDNLDVELIKERSLNFPEKMSEAVSQLEPYFQILLLSQNIQMVMGGLKPATSISIDKNLIAEYQRAGLVGKVDFSVMHRVLYEVFGLRLTEKLDGFDADRQDYFIYNPQLMGQISGKFARLAPYGGSDLNSWIRQCEKSAPLDYIYGLLYGYPVSAVKQFVKYQTGEDCRVSGRRIINSYGEAFVTWGVSNKRDVMIRERIKEAFFTYLADQHLYINLSRMLQLQAQDYRRVSHTNFEKMIAYSQNFYKL